MHETAQRGRGWRVRKQSLCNRDVTSKPTWMSAWIPFGHIHGVFAYEPSSLFLALISALSSGALKNQKYI